MKDWVTLISVAYLGYGRHGTCHGRHFDGAQKLLGKIKIFIYSFFNLYFAPHAFTNCKAVSTPRPHLKHYVGRVALAPLSIMTKLRYCDITQGSDIATEQECSLAMSSVHDASSFSRYKKG